MSVFKTSKNRFVTHCHLGQTPWCARLDHSPEAIEIIRRIIRETFPDAEELGRPTFRFNCMGFALARSHGWFNFPGVILADDFISVSFSSPREGDVVKYVKDGKLAHVAIVTDVSNGKIIRVSSKWGDWSELSHRLNDVHENFGSPVEELVRPRPGVVPFAAVTDERETWETRTYRGLEVKSKMPDHKSRPELIDRSVALFLNPEVYLLVGLASTPEVARSIIETLPGVQELIKQGPEAVPAILDVLKLAQQGNNQHLLGIALYLLQRIPTEAAVETLARGISDGDFNGINLHLAADALIASADIQNVNEDPVLVAIREAENLK